HLTLSSPGGFPIGPPCIWKCVHNGPAHCQEDGDDGDDSDGDNPDARLPVCMVKRTVNTTSALMKATAKNL
ncbi:MAG TPA: hypothetical protein VMF12_14230, partial [Xanthobacteraceae bacterium]|nr:hypothetical protein [Xanthobacteraceae bacterium]